jgi:hypothetical protein
VAWLLPELELGAEPELKPLEPELELELEPEPEPEPELELELEPVELEPVLGVELVLGDEPEPDEVPVDEPDDAEELCVEPGRARATTPATATLAMVTVVVADRTLARPRSLSAMARRTRSRCALLMSPILRSGIRSLLQETSRLAMRHAARAAPSGQRLPSQHEAKLKRQNRGWDAGLAGHNRDPMATLREVVMSQKDDIMKAVTARDPPPPAQGRCGRSPKRLPRSPPAVALQARRSSRSPKA